MRVELTARGEVILPLELLIHRLSEYRQLGRTATFECFRAWLTTDFMLVYCSQYATTIGGNSLEAFERWTRLQLEMAESMFTDPDIPRAIEEGPQDHEMA
jgi:DMSO/TMAO reductase YedYZ molybdopterin-dependent catalytic subunit